MIEEALVNQDYQKQALIPTALQIDDEGNIVIQIESGIVSLADDDVSTLDLIRDKFALSLSFYPNQESVDWFITKFY